MGYVFKNFKTGGEDGMTPPQAGYISLAERTGFEPVIPCGIRAFQARALDQLCDLSNNLAYFVFWERGAEKEPL